MSDWLEGCLDGVAAMKRGVGWKHGGSRGVPVPWERSEDANGGRAKWDVRISF